MLRRGLALLPFAAAALPPALVAWTMAREALDVPFWDDWELVDLLQRASAGTLRFGDLWAQHNEHRLLLPNLVMLGLARATGWDTRVTMGASFIVSLGTLAVLGLIIQSTIRRSAPAFSPWVFLGASLMTFSMVAWQNWLWAWQVQVFMNALAACVMAWSLGRYGARAPGPWLAMLAAIAGALTFANGVALLPIVPVVLALDPRGDATVWWRRRPAITMAVIGALAVAIYLIGYERPPDHPSPLVALAHPLDLLRFLLAYLGAPVALGWRLAASTSTTPVVLISIAYGAIGLGVVVAGGAWLWRRDASDRALLVPWVALVLFTVLSGIMTGVGRLGVSLDQALASRYTTTSALFWVSVAALAALAMSRALRAHTEISRRVMTLGAVAVLAQVMVLVGYAGSWAYGLGMAAVKHETLRRGGECLRFYRSAPPACLKLLYPDVAGLRDRASRLETLALGPFAASRRERPLASYAVAEGAEAAGGIDFLGPDESRTEFILVGWGMNPVTRRAVDAVLVAIDGEVIGRAVTGLQRPDLATGEDASLLASSGWTFRFSAFRLQPGSHAIEAYAVLEQQRIVKLHGARTIEVKART